ncbi:helix-turn-helix domain-containing protein [Sinanaerobacter chloroacetimidivorans]|jgi:excisionase family DNA binding protein|uniref:Helix-turn-helix domain-containing protein n=1 Tax=Sinanaerobacter chloroacetimidivorans TaxID=2818044 RepID=A0A8J7W2W6_9FIRM|nr:helix-turn-helix domain-containing protein [Sinanaerobacter chloroacetimidivorans]
MPADYKYLTIEDLIEMLQVTRSTIYNLKKKGLPFIKIGSNIRFEQSEVIDWLNSNHKREVDTDKQV